MSDLARADVSRADVTRILAPHFDLSSNQAPTDTRRYTLLGWAVIVLGLGSFLVWAGIAPLAKGVPLSGTVIVETNRKAVQHPTGGTVEAVLVQEGQKVKAGDPLLRLNRVQASADAEMNRVQYFSAKATEARLRAELSGAAVLDVPKDLVSSKKDPRLLSNLALQQQLLSSRKAAKSKEFAALDEHIAGVRAQIKGLEETKQNKEKQRGFALEQIESQRDMAKGGFISRTRILDLEQSLAQINASISEDSGNIAKNQKQVAELNLKKQQSVQEYQRELQSQLAEVQRESSALSNRLAGLDYSLSKVLVTAPSAGTVMGLTVFSAGAVIAPGARIMDIVPLDDRLMVEGRLPVHLIDKVHTGLDIVMMFTAFNQNKTPHVAGQVTQVSADRFVDERSGEPYYKVLAKVAPEAIKTVANLGIKAGMPVDLFVKTGERTLLNYLLKPLQDHYEMALSQD